MNKLEIMRRCIDVAAGRGIEIGPLTAPIVTRDPGKVFYADHATTEELREKYRDDPAIDVSRIVPVDFVWGARTLAEATVSAGPFDYAVASHVLEHVPDLVGWLQEVSAVLRPGGRLSLALPDRRYTFDVRRRESDLSEVIEAYLLRLRRPAIRATFDHFYRHVDVDTGALWRGEKGHAGPPLNFLNAAGAARRAAETNAYIDTHCWVFTDASFVGLMGSLMAVGLVDLRFVDFTRTRHNEFEFFATLERLPENLGPEERKRQCLASLPAVESSPASSEAPPPPMTLPPAAGLELSELELKAVHLKRRIMTRLRATLRSVAPASRR